MGATTTSKQFTLNWRDILRGLLIAVISPVFTIIISSLSSGEFILNWKAIGIVALGGFLSYISKNFLTPAQIVVTGESKATMEAVKDGTAEVNVTKKD